MHPNLLRAALSQRSPSLALRLAGRPAFASSPALISQRYLSINNGAPSLQSSRIGDKPGVEGLHQHDSKAVTTPDSSKQAHELLPASSVLRGDWVLFHPVYTPEELKAVEVMFREAKTFPDKIAAGFVKSLRLGFDFVSRYKHKEIPPKSSMTLQQLREAGYAMDPTQWLARIIFLETTAAVPGMVAATLRHLRSLRLMKRDSGWIHTLLEEAENERMHLMTFMTLREPPVWLRALCLAAQGVFYNLFFFSYIISPRTCHRFVGHLEEEAVLTYTKCIKDIEEGRLPEWSEHPAPEIAKDYWRLNHDATMLDVIYAVRSDESTHRFVNHSLANLKYESDVNPFAFGEPDMHTKGTKLGFERNEADAYVEHTRKLFEDSERGAKSDRH